VQTELVLFDRNANTQTVSVFNRFFRLVCNNSERKLNVYPIPVRKFISCVVFI